MKHLESFDTNKTVQDFFDIINKDYNLKDIGDMIIHNMNRYDIEDFNTRNMALTLRIFDDRGFNDLVLQMTFNGNDLTFDKLDRYVLSRRLALAQNIHHTVMYDNNKNLTKDPNDCIGLIVKGLQFRIGILTYADKNPIDIVMEALSFLESKYGFDSRIVDDGNYRKIMFDKLIS